MQPSNTNDDVVVGVPQPPPPMAYAPSAIQGVLPIVRLPNVSCLRFWNIVLALLGIAQVFSIQGILALTIAWKFGCCCGSPEGMIRELTGRRGCCSLNCRAAAVVAMCGVYLAAAVMGDTYLSSVCGIVITDKSNPLQAAAYTLGLASIGAGEAAWQVANPTASAPVDIEDEAGSFAWAFVYPSDVCDFMPPLESSGEPCVERCQLP